MKSTVYGGVEYRHYDHLYAVSRGGKLFHLKKRCRVQPEMRPDGYMRAGNSRRLLHRAVATCWLDKPPNAKHVHHKNEDKADNRADNLEWVTPKEHVTRHGTGWGCYAPMPESGKLKLRAFRLGTTVPQEVREKTSSTMRAIWAEWKRVGYRPHHGHLHTEETKQKMSRNHAKNTACEVDGVVYRSFAEAAKARGEKRFSLRKRCLSSNFSNYRVL